MVGQLRAEIGPNSEGPKGFTVEGNKVLYKGRIVLPKKSQFIPLLLKEYHDTPTGGHDGEVKTYLRAAGEWYWQSMRKAVGDYVRKCETCQRNKGGQQQPQALLQPLPIPTAILADISMDFIEGLPPSKGIDAILVVVDRFSKYAHFIGLKHPFNALKVADHFVKEVIKLHGFPESIVSDRDRVFMSKFWRELFRLQGTHLKRSTAYHPQTDGQSEIVNKGVEAYIRCFIAGKPKSWAQWLAWAEYSYNTSPHSATKMSPFKVVYGREPPRLFRVGKGQTPVDQVEEWLQERDYMLDELRLNLFRAQQVMRKYADQKRRHENFEVGEKVFLKLQPYRQKSLAIRPNEKLAARFYGPFTVVQKIGKVAYKLDLPPSSKIHPVFHISQLKRSVGDMATNPTIPEQLSSELELLVEPEAVLEVRTRPRRGVIRTEVLIKWTGLPLFEATWEDGEMLAQRFPEFHLEDKVNLQRGSNVIDQGGSREASPNLQVYTRKKKKVLGQLSNLMICTSQD